MTSRFKKLMARLLTNPEVKVGCDAPVPEFDRHSFVTAGLSDATVQEIISSRMDERHAHLDIVLESLPHGIASAKKS